MSPLGSQLLCVSNTETTSMGPIHRLRVSKDEAEAGTQLEVWFLKRLQLPHAECYR